MSSDEALILSPFTSFFFFIYGNLISPPSSLFLFFIFVFFYLLILFFFFSVVLSLVFLSPSLPLVIVSLFSLSYYAFLFLPPFSIRVFHLLNSSVSSLLPLSLSLSLSPHTRVWNQAMTINIKQFQATKSVKLRKHGIVCSRHVRIFLSSF